MSNSSNPIELGVGNIISRLVKERDKQYIDKDKLKPAAFVYGAPDNISVVHSNDLNDNAIWEIGDEKIFKPISQKTIARADIEVIKIIKENCIVVRDDKNFKYHSYIKPKISMSIKEITQLLSMLSKDNVKER